jgi:hypothetical protein
VDSRAIEHANIRFEQAVLALSKLRDAESYETAERGWQDFLTATGGIFAKLEQGAKISGQSLAWFGRLKHQRKNNPVLKYIHFARNAQEHGLERVTRRDQDANLAGGPLPFGKRIQYDNCKYTDAWGNQIGELFTAWAYGPSVKCVLAKDSRYGDECPPPIEELARTGKFGADPVDLAEIALPIIREIIDDAIKLVV